MHKHVGPTLICVFMLEPKKKINQALDQQNINWHVFCQDLSPFIKQIYQMEYVFSFSIMSFYVILS